MSRRMSWISLPLRTQIIVPLVVLLSAALCVSTGSAECLHYERLMHVIAWEQMSGGPRSVVVSGDYAYTANASFGFQVVNISNPIQPQIQASVGTTFATDVALSDSGPYAYVADRFSMKVVDISNPTPLNLKIVGQLSTPDEAFYVATSGSYVYVGNGLSGLRVIDVSNPLQPVFVTALDTPGSTHEIAISGSYAYVADGSDGLLVVDISNPSSPAIVGSVATPEDAQRVVISGAYAYVIDGPWVHVIDISSPTAPVIIATVNNLAPRNLFATATRLYTVGASSLGVVDISNPAAPITLGTATISNTGGDDVFVRGSYAYVVELSSGHFDVFDVTYSFPPTLQTFPLGGYLAVLGTHLYSVSNNTLSVIDVSNPVSPTVTGTVGIPNGEIVAQGSYAYVLSSGSTLNVIDISNPAAPTIIGSLPVSGTKLVVSGSHVYIVWNGIEVVDVSNPASPVLVGSRVVGGSGPWFNIAASGSLAFITGGSGMAIFNVTNPASPSLIGTPSIKGALSISGSYMYVKDQFGPFSIYTLSSSPSLLGSVSIPGTPHSSPVVSGTFAYLVTDNGGLHAIDVSDVAAPRDLGSLPVLVGVNHLVASEFNVYSSSSSTLSILPVQCGNNAPIVQDPGTHNGSELTFFSVTVTATDPDADPLTMSPIGSLPAWAVFSDVGGGTALLRGTPQVGQAGTYPISIRSSDGKAADTTSFNVVITPALATVNLQSSGFTPGSFTIRAGTPVKWIKIAGGNHTTTNGTGPLDPAAGTLWDAQLRSTSPEFTRTFPIGGTFPYFCRNHPSETGTITVSTAQTGVGEPVSLRFRLAASPNPFRAGVDLQFDLERDAHVSVVILDLQGRQVRELVAGEFPAGTHRVSWEGRDDNRALVGPGLYFARLVTDDGHVQVQKLFKIR